MTESGFTSSPVAGQADLAGAADPVVGVGLDPELLRVTPELNRYFDEMQEAVGDRRVIIVRQGGMVSIGSVIALMGALAFHVFLLVLVYLAWKLIIASPWHWGPGKWTNLAENGGRPGTSFTMLGTGDFTGTDTNPYMGPLAAAQAGAKPATAVPLPDLPADWPKAAAAATPQDAAPLIGVPSELSFPAHKPAQFPAHAVPAPTPVPQVTPPGPVVVGPNVQLPPTDQVASTGHGATVISGTGSIAKVGNRPGGDSDDGNDEPTIQITRGHGGHGKGAGAGEGDGLDRGASGANNESPGIIYNPQPDLPVAMMLKPINGKAIFNVMVRTDGTAGEIKLAQSCGDATVDAACRTALARWRFRPAYRKAQPFEAMTQIAFTFGGNVDN
jgi:TonB family protein